MTQLASVLGHIRRLVGVRAVEAGTDAELLAQFVQTRKEAAFARLVERHGPMVRAVCRRVLQHDADADDAFQATFLVLARKADAIRKYDSVGSWLYGTAYRLALKMRAGVQKRQAREGSVPATPPETTAVSTTAPGLDQHELRALLDQELSLLPEKYRAPLVLCYLEGRTNEEAAQQLNWTKGTVSGRLARARDLLRARLARRGLSLPAAALAATLTEQLAAGQVPRNLLETTTSAAVAFAVGAGMSVRAAALAEGVLHTMWLAKLKVAALVFLTVGLAGGAGLLALRSTSVSVAAPLGPVEEAKPTTDPPGVPLELRLVAKKDTYKLDLGGMTPAQARQAIEESKIDLPTPEVDLELELTNTGSETLTIGTVGGGHRVLTAPEPGPDQVGLVFDLQGPGAVNWKLEGREAWQLRTPNESVDYIFAPGNLATLEPGKTRTIPVRGLGGMVCLVKEPGIKYSARYWVEPGQYTLAAALHLAVSPTPKGSQTAFGEFGYVTVHSNAVKLKVVEDKVEGKTDPPGVPLELKLVAKKNTYALDLGGMTAEQFRQHLDAQRKKADQRKDDTLIVPGLPGANFPPPPQVDLELEVRNTGDRELELWQLEKGRGAANAYVSLELRGPGAVKVDTSHPVGIGLSNGPEALRLAPGKVYTMKLTELRGGVESMDYWYWLQAGNYTLQARVLTAVSPLPQGAKDLGDNELGIGPSPRKGFGYVKLVSEPVKLQVVDSQAAKSNPPGVPLELKLVAKKDSATLDLGGKTPEEFRALLKKAEGDRQDVPPASAADLTLEFRNTGTQEIRFWVGGDPTFYRLQLEGPGTASLVAALRKNELYVNPRVITLAPGKSHQIEQADLSFGNAQEFHRAYWTTPGEYTLTAVYETAVSPRPANIKPIGDDFGRVTLTAPPIRIKVGEAPQGKAEPAGTPLELKLTSKKDSYTLNLGGKTPAEFRKALKDAFRKGDPPPPAPEVDLELQVKNTSKEAVTFMVGGDSLTVHLQLEGAGAVSGPSGMNFTDVVRPGRLLTLKSGETHTFGWTRLTYGQRGASDVAFWTQPGDYRLTAIVKTSIPGPDSKSGQSQPIELTSAPVTLKVVEPQK